MGRFRSLPIVLLYACLTAFAVKSGAATIWKSVAINGGGFVSGILFHPAEANLIYARTDVGGAYRWDRLTWRWIALNDDIGGLNNEFMHLGVLSFAVDPNDTNRLYLACGQYTWNESWNPTGIILSSTDRGATWVRTTLSVRCGGNEDGRNTGERLQVDPNDGSVLFFGTNQDGLWRSADHGASWARVPAFPATSCTLVLFDRTTGSAGSATQTIYVGVNTTTGTSLYCSTDGGATWSPVAGQPSGLIPHHADIGYAAAGRMLYLAYSNAIGPNGAGAGAVWRLNVTTGAWTDVTPARGAWGYGGVSVAASDPRIVVASTLDRWGPRDEIYRSTDGGNTWRGILQGGSLDTSSAPWAAASTPHWTADVKVDPFDPGRAVFVTGYGLFASDNVAATAPVWEFRDAGLEETVPAMFVSPPSGPPLVSVVGDVDGFRHDNVYLAPSSRLAPLEGSNTSIDFAESSPSVMARTFNAASRGAWSADGGGTWTLFAGAPAPNSDGGKIAVSADGARFVWTQASMTPYFSTNHGTTWTSSSGAPTGFAPVADRVNASKFYVYDSSAGRVHVSTDGAASFSAAAPVPAGGSPMRAVPGIEGNLWLPAWSGGLLRSTDSGATFSAVSGVQEGYAVGFGKAAAGQAHPAVFIWGRVAGVTGLFRSDDAGGTWGRINDDRHQFGYINWIAGDPRAYGRVYLATSGRGIIYGDIAIAPSITWDPEDQVVRTDQIASFVVQADGLPAPTFQWEVSTDGMTDWTDLPDEPGNYSGVTLSTLDVRPTMAMNRTWYRCRVSNMAGERVSQGAMLTVSLSDGDIVRLLFEDVLGRPADDGALAAFEAALAAGRTPAQVLGDLYASAEYATWQIEPVIRLYYAAFARMPDYDGLRNWSNALHAGVLALTQAADQFAGSPEFIQTYGSLDNTQFVQQLYRNVLGREADTAGLNDWVGRLDAGASRGTILAGFSESDEFKAGMADRVEVLRLICLLDRQMPGDADLKYWLGFLKGYGLTDALYVRGYPSGLSNADYVQAVFRGFLWRDADPGALSTFGAALAAGTATHGSLVETLMNSDEFNLFVAPVSRLYLAALRRVPDQPGLDNWVNFVRAGTSLQVMADAFASSQEFINRYGAMSNREYVSQLYRDVLGREADTPGLDHWTGLLDAGGTTRGQILIGFSESQEAIHLFAPTLRTFLHYFAFVDAAPAQRELDYWVNYLATLTDQMRQTCLVRVGAVR